MYFRSISKKYVQGSEAIPGFTSQIFELRPGEENDPKSSSAAEGYAYIRYNHHGILELSLHKNLIDVASHEMQWTKT